MTESSDLSGAGGRIPIVQVITHLPMGGAQRVVLTLASMLDRSRYELHLISGPRGDWLDRAMEIGDCSFHPAKHLVRELSFVHDSRVVPEIFGILDSIKKFSGGKKPIVHTHAPKAGLAGRLAARLCACYPVHTLHGFPFYADQGKLKKNAYRLFERCGYFCGGEVISVSETNRRALLEYGWVDESRISLIRPCVQLDALAPRSGPRKLMTDFGIPEDARVVGFVGSLKAPKDPLGFIRAFSRICHNRPELHALIVGDGENRREVEAAISETGMNERYTLVGWYDPIEELYPELDLFVLATFSEGLPLSIIEARAAGVPIVANDVGGVGEIVQHDETGLLVATGDESGLSQAMASLIDDRDRYERIRKNALSGLEEFDQARMTRKHEELYEKITDQKKYV